MKNDFLAILDASSYATELYPLTATRSSGSVPFFGKYRLADFTITSLSNSGCKNIILYPGRNSQSLIDHVGDGTAWNLNLNKDGIFIANTTNAHVDRVIPYFLMRKNYAHLRRSKQKYVILGHTSVIHNINFSEVVEKHVASGKEISILTHKGNDIAFYIIRKDLLLEIIDNYREFYEIDIKHTILRKEYENEINHIKINCYYEPVSSFLRYYSLTMELLDNLEDSEERVLVHDYLNKISTKLNFTPPTRVNKKCSIINSRIANGSKLAGTIQKSVIFRNVVVEEGSYIKNSIIMANVKIGKNVVIENAVIDKSTVIKDGQKIVGTTDYPKYLSDKREY